MELDLPENVDEEIAALEKDLGMVEVLDDDETLADLAKRADLGKWDL